MNGSMKFLCLSALLTASSAAFADPHISVNINPFGWGAPPPVVYAPPRYYGPPPLVYDGRGRWGDRGHYRDHRDHRDHRR